MKFLLTYCLLLQGPSAGLYFLKQDSAKALEMCVKQGYQFNVGTMLHGQANAS